jgi:hypothetical protein
MKQREYIEGLQATENFEKGMKTLFKVPKNSTTKAQKKRKKSASQAKPQKSDRD